MKALVLILSCLVLPILLFAQDESSGFAPDRYGIQGEYGFVIPHRPHMKSLIKGHSPAMRARAEWQCSGKKEWHKLYRMPSIGAEFQWTDLGNPEELGYSSALYSYLRLPLTGSQKIKQDLRLGMGLVHLSERYNIEANDKNLAAGSNFNAAIFIQYLSSFPIGENVNFTAGLGLTHFSNAAYQLPNLGMNIASVAVGVEFDSSAEKEPIEKYTPDVRDVSGSFSTYLGFGLHEDFPPEGPKYLVLNLGTEYLYRISPKSSVLGRADLFYSEAVRAAMASNEEPSNPRGEAIQAGLGAGYAIHFGDFLIRMMVGAYLVDNYGLNGSIYNRFGVQQRINEHLSLALGLKTHFAKAHHFEAGIGWTW